MSEELLAVAVEVAQLAGGLLIERYQGARDDGISAKSTPTDLVSDADRDSERAIVTRLSELRPHDGVLGEEGAGSEGETGLRWVVDPLDGTVNFLFGIPQWSVSVAVQDADRSTLAGVVLDPCRNELWAASNVSHATLNGERIEGSDRSDLSTAMVATGLAYDAEVRARQAQVLASLIPKVRDIRRFGSAALDLAWTAAGRYDAYYERGVKLWDVAAGALICRQAGLALRDLPQRGPLPAGILAASSRLTEPLLQIVA